MNNALKTDIKKPKKDPIVASTNAIGNIDISSKEGVVNEAMDLLKFNSVLDRKIMGNMKGDNIRDGTKNVFYGKEERITPLQMSARNIILKWVIL